MLKFICNQSNLATAITQVAKGVAVKSTMPSLEKMKLHLDHDALELTGYDMEFGIQYTLNVESEDSGEFLVPAKLFADAVRHFNNEELTIILEDNMTIRMESADADFQMIAMPADEYPSIPALDMENGIQIEQSTLNSMIRQTIYAAATTDVKPILTGALFELNDNKLNVVAIDGFRLAIRTEQINCEESFKFVVPRKTLNEVAGMLKDDEKNLCSISANEKYVVFEFNGYTVFSRLLNGEFLNYRSSIPTNYETTAELDKIALIHTLERCALLSVSKENTPVRCTFTEGVLQINCKTAQGETKDKLFGNITGKELTIGFDVRYLLDAIKNADTDKIRMELVAPHRAAVVKPLSGDSFTFLLMPIQIR